MAGDELTFKKLRDATDEDWEKILARRDSRGRNHMVPDHILFQLQATRGSYHIGVGDRLTHSLQTATMAERDGRDDEYILCCLLHDIGANLAPGPNHGALAAAILKFYVSEANWWMVDKHNIFNGHYFWDKVGRDPNARDEFKDSPYFDYTDEFCVKYDGPACDPEYKTEPLEHFEPLVREIMGKPPKAERDPWLVDAQLLQAHGHAAS